MCPLDERAHLHTHARKHMPLSKRAHLYSHISAAPWKAVADSGPCPGFQHARPQQQPAGTPETLQTPLFTQPPRPGPARIPRTAGSPPTPLKIPPPRPRPPGGVPRPRPDGGGPRASVGGVVSAACLRAVRAAASAVGAAWAVVLEKQDGGDGGRGGGGGGHRAAGPAGADAGEQRGPEPHQGRAGDRGPEEGRPAALAGRGAFVDGEHHKGARGASAVPPGLRSEPAGSLGAVHAGSRVTPGEPHGPASLSRRRPTPASSPRLPPRRPHPASGGPVPGCPPPPASGGPTPHAPWLFPAFGLSCRAASVSTCKWTYRA